MSIKFPIVSKYGSLAFRNKIILNDSSLSSEVQSHIRILFQNSYMNKQFKSIVLSRIYQILISCHEGLSQLSVLHYAKKIESMDVSRKAIH